MLASCSAPRRRPACVGVGVAVRASSAARDGLVRFAPNLGWPDVPFGHLLARGDGGPARAWSATTPTSASSPSTAAGRPRARRRRLPLRRRRRRWRGHRRRASLLGAGGYAGEVGHLIVDPHGRACRCGSPRLLGDRGRRARRRPRRVRSRAAWEELAAAVRSARELGAAVRRLAGSRIPWAIGIGNVVNLVNPQLVVLGGVLQEVLRSAGDEVRAALDATALRAAAEQVRLALPELRRRRRARGCRRGGLAGSAWPTRSRCSRRPREWSRRPRRLAGAGTATRRPRLGADRGGLAARPLPPPTTAATPS